MVKGRRWLWSVPLVFACAEEAAAPVDSLAARAFFDKVRAMSDAYDPGLPDVYSDAAYIRITTNTATGEVREKELSGAFYKDGLRRFIRSSKRSERTNSPRYSNISVHREAHGFRIAAIRYSFKDCHEDELFSMMVAPNAHGVWQITQSYSQLWEVSACADAGTPAPLAERLRAMAESMNEILPWPAGNGARLERVTAGETHLAYRYTILGPDPFAASEKVQSGVERYSCSRLEERSIIADGGTLVYEYFDVRGRPVRWFVVSHCPEP